jgi:hypothetical protein
MFPSEHSGFKRVKQTRDKMLSCETFSKPYMKMQMSHAVRFLILGALFLVGCRTARTVAVSSFRVIDAPANYVRHHIDDNGATTTTTTSTYQSDVGAPGQPVVTQAPPDRRTTVRHRTSEVDRESAANRESESRPKTSSPSSQHSASSPQASKLPYAKPVPGKPGYVYSPFDPNGGYVDVTGYPAGSKAKDPYSGKIFIVP